MNDFTAIANVIAERLAGSDLFRNYRDAFLLTAGLRITLDPLSIQRPDTAIPSVLRLRLPVQAGTQSVAWVTMQPVVVQNTAFRSFDDVALAMLDDGQSATEVRAARDHYAKLPVLSEERYNALQTMLGMFAGQLSEIGERLFLQATESEPEVIRKARAYILNRLAEPLSLDEVACHAGVSPFHFCKIFKRFTSFTFTEFVNRARIDHAKRLLLKPRSRVTEVAYDVGFQSLSQFNRSFRRVTSQSPTEYRDRLNSDPVAFAAA